MEACQVESSCVYKRSNSILHLLQTRPVHARGTSSTRAQDFDRGFRLMSDVPPDRRMFIYTHASWQIVSRRRCAVTQRNSLRLLMTGSIRMITNSERFHWYGKILLKFSHNASPFTNKTLFVAAFFSPGCIIVCLSTLSSSFFLFLFSLNTYVCVVKLWYFNARTVGFSYLQSSQWSKLTSISVQ